MRLPGDIAEQWQFFISEELAKPAACAAIFGATLMFNLKHAPFETQLAALHLLADGTVTNRDDHNHFVAALTGMQSTGMTFRLSIPANLGKAA